jgi:hypothetical protein
MFQNVLNDPILQFAEKMLKPIRLLGEVLMADLIGKTCPTILGSCVTGEVKRG